MGALIFGILDLGGMGVDPPSPTKFLGLISLLTECPSLFHSSAGLQGVLSGTHTPPRWRRTPVRAGHTEWGPRQCLCLCSGLRLLPWTRFSARDIFSELACSLILLPFSAQKHLWVPGDVPHRSYPVHGSRPDRWRMEFSLVFWLGMQQAWEGL